MPQPLVLKAKNRKAPELGPKVRVETAHLSPAGDDSALAPLINGAGLRDWDKDGLKEHDTATKNMWCGTCASGLALEFELPEPVKLGAIEVWNYNAEWTTTNGVRKADVSVSADGQSWQTVLRGVEFAQAEGSADYDTPTVLQLKGVTARKVRFENLTPWGSGNQVGLSAVVFHQAPGPQAGPLQPEDGTTTVGAAKAALRWVPGDGATEHQVYLGSSADKLESLGKAQQPQFEGPQLKPNSTYFWRVDEVTSNGQVTKGRVAKFTTAGLVAWWKLDETKGPKVEDASGHGLTGKVAGKALWAPDQGKFGGALEFDGNTTFVNCGKGAEFDFADGMTVSAWVKVRKFNKNWQAIVTKGDTAWRLQRQGNTGKVTFSLNSGSEDDPQGLVKTTSKRSVDDGQWHHLVGVTDGQQVALYLDGELEDSAKAKAIAQNSFPVMIGCNAEFYERRFNGWIDDVRLYGYGLSAEEVKALYQGGSTERAQK
jgi:hypothetical protein